MKKTVALGKNVRRERAERLKAAVMRLLKWSEMQFAQFQYEQGMAYLNAYFLDDMAGISTMERSRTFWAWWKNQWTNSDEGFVVNVKHLDRQASEQVYIIMHDGRFLSGKIRPHRAVLEVNDFIETI